MKLCDEVSWFFTKRLVCVFRDHIWVQYTLTICDRCYIIKPDRVRLREAKRLKKESA